MIQTGACEQKKNYRAEFVKVFATNLLHHANHNELRQQSIDNQIIAELKAEITTLKAKLEQADKLAQRNDDDFKKKDKAMSDRFEKLLKNINGVVDEKNKQIEVAKKNERCLSARIEELERFIKNSKDNSTTIQAQTKTQIQFFKEHFAKIVKEFQEQNVDNCVLLNNFERLQAEEQEVNAKHQLIVNHLKTLQSEIKTLRDHQRTLLEENLNLKFTIDELNIAVTHQKQIDPAVQSHKLELQTVTKTLCELNERMDLQVNLFNENRAMKQRLIWMSSQYNELMIKYNQTNQKLADYQLQHHPQEHERQMKQRSPTTFQYLYKKAQEVKQFESDLKQLHACSRETSTKVDKLINERNKQNFMLRGQLNDKQTQLQNAFIKIVDYKKQLQQLIDAEGKGKRNKSTKPKNVRCAHCVLMVSKDCECLCGVCAKQIHRHCIKVQKYMDCTETSRMEPDE